MVVLEKINILFARLVKKAMTTDGKNVHSSQISLEKSGERSPKVRLIHISDGPTGRKKQNKKVLTPINSCTVHLLRL